jgi:DNA polymerase III subunit delta'
MPFSHLVGNERAKNALQQMLLKRAVPSTLLFAAPRGIGIEQFALAFATALLGVGHAKKIKEKIHPDVHHIAPEEKMHSISMIKEMIDEMKLPPFEAPKKVFIIYEAHAMLPSSANALLKTLEEPPLDTHIILISDQSEAMLSTVKSRARMINFAPLSNEEIENHLSALPAEKAKQIAEIAQGSLTRADALSKSHPLYDAVIAILSQELYYDYPALLKALADLERLFEESGADEESLDFICELILYWYRDSYLLAQSGKAEYLFHQNHREILQKQDVQISFEELFKTLNLSRASFFRGIKLRTLLEHFFLKVI